MSVFCCIVFTDILVYLMYSLAQHYLRVFRTQECVIVLWKTVHEIYIIWPRRNGDVLTKVYLRKQYYIKRNYHLGLQSNLSQCVSGWW